MAVSWLIVASLLVGLDNPGPDRRIDLEGDVLILPSEVPQDGRLDLIVHLHGALPAIERALDESRWPAAALVVNRPGLSSAYAGPFSDPELFPRLLDQARSALKEAAPGADLDAGRLVVSAFSAGFGGVRELLKQPEAVEQIDAIILADALYCGYQGDDLDRRQLDPEKMAGFRHFAQLAAEGRKAMLVSHSAQIPDGYGSTTETADDLVAVVGGRFEAADRDVGDGWRLSRRFERGGLLVLGFQGAGPEDHLRHLRRLGELWRELNWPQDARPQEPDGPARR